MTARNGPAPAHLSPTEQRGLVRRLLDVWGFVPDLTASHDDVRVTTRDGVRLAGSYLHGPPAPAGAWRAPQWNGANATPSGSCTTGR